MSADIYTCSPYYYDVISGDGSSCKRFLQGSGTTLMYPLSISVPPFPHISVRFFLMNSVDFISTPCTSRSTYTTFSDLVVFVVTQSFIMADQQLSAYSWNAPVGNPPIFGPPSNAPAEGLVNAPSGITVGHFPPVGTPATAAGFASAPMEPIPDSTGDFAIGNPNVALPGDAYAPTGGLINAFAGGLAHGLSVGGPATNAGFYQRADRTNPGV